MHCIKLFCSFPQYFYLLWWGPFFVFISLFFLVLKNEISGTEFYVTVQVIFVNISHRYINHVVRAFFKKVIGGAVTPISDSPMLQI